MRSYGPCGGGHHEDRGTEEVGPGQEQEVPCAHRREGPGGGHREGFPQTAHLWLAQPVLGPGSTPLARRRGRPCPWSATGEDTSVLPGPRAQRSPHHHCVDIDCLGPVPVLPSVRLSVPRAAAPQVTGGHALPGPPPQPDCPGPFFGHFLCEGSLTVPLPTASAWECVCPASVWHRAARGILAAREENKHQLERARANTCLF